MAGFLVGTCNYYDPTKPATKLYVVDLVDGQLKLSHAIPSVRNPQFLALHGQHLYTVSDEEDGSGHLVSYRWDPASRTAAYLNRVDTCGSCPAYLSIVPAAAAASAPSSASTAPLALVANYMGGSVCVVPLSPDGSLQPATDSKHHDGVLDPALADRQEMPHPHAIHVDPYTRQWVLVPDLGLDTLFVYRLLASHAALAGARSSALLVRFPTGSGPRHLAFHPSQPVVYLLHELTAQLSVLSLDVRSGTLTSLQTVALLPEGVVPNRGHHMGSAHVAVDGAGEVLYATNRTDRTLVAFRIVEGGRLRLASRVSTRGEVPRHFALTADGSHVVLGNQNSKTLVVFRVDGAGGVEYVSELAVDEPPVYVLPL